MNIIPCGIPEIDQYCENILKEEIPSCIYVKQAAQRFQNDLQRAEEGWDYYFEPAASKHFFDFVEGHLQHFQGHLSGKPIKLEPFQKFILGQLFG